jgi:hypothetical protein
VIKTKACTLSGIYLASLSCILFWAFPLCAGCIQPVSQDVVGDFLKEPHSLLDSSQRGDEAFIGTVRDYASVSEDALKAIVAIVPDADPRQRRAIGTALGRAATACASQRPEISRRIVIAIRSISDDEVLRSFNRVTAAPAVLQTEAKPPAGRPSAAALGVDLSHPVSRKGLALEDPFKPFQPMDRNR